MQTEDSRGWLDFRCSTRTRQMIDLVKTGKLRGREVIMLLVACIDRIFSENFKFAVTVDQAVELQNRVARLANAVTFLTEDLIRAKHAQGVLDALIAGAELDLATDDWDEDGDW